MNFENQFANLMKQIEKPEVLTLIVSLLIFVIIFKILSSRKNIDKTISIIISGTIALFSARMLYNYFNKFSSDQITKYLTQLNSNHLGTLILALIPILILVYVIHSITLTQNIRQSILGIYGLIFAFTTFGFDSLKQTYPFWGSILLILIAIGLDKEINDLIKERKKTKKQNES